MDFINKSSKNAERVAFVRTVRGWIEHAIRLRTDLSQDKTSNHDDDSDSDDDMFGFTVLVQEMQCNIPGCAPIETVVALLKSGSNHSGKIFKPIAEVTREEAEELLERMLSTDQEIAEHKSDSGEVKTTTPATTTTKTPTATTTTATATTTTTMQTDNDPHPFLCPCCNPEVTKFDKVSVTKKYLVL